MADGTTKPISEVKVGDEVLATDPETGEQGPRQVTAVWAHEDTVLKLTLENGATITTTEDHPFYSTTDKAWQQADQLEKGESLLTPSGQHIPVIGIQGGTAQITTAYNLTVNDIHTYYVLAKTFPVLVHNSCPPLGPRMHYEPNPKHASGRTGGRVGPEPGNGQKMLDESLLFNSNSNRRVAYDRSTGEIVVLAPHQGGVYHGYVSTWADLPQDAKNTLVRAGIFKPSGKVR